MTLCCPDNYYWCGKVSDPPWSLERAWSWSFWVLVFWLIGSFQHFSPFHVTVFFWFPKLILAFQKFHFCLLGFFFFPQEENLGFSLYPLTAQEFFSKAEPRPLKCTLLNWAMGYRQLNPCAMDCRVCRHRPIGNGMAWDSVHRYCVCIWDNFNVSYVRGKDFS